VENTYQGKQSRKIAEVLLGRSGLGNASASGRVLPQALNNTALAQVIHAQKGNAGGLRSVLPHAVNNAPLAPVIQAQQGNAGALRSVVPGPQANDSDDGECEIAHASRDNLPLQGGLLRALQKNHEAQNIVPTG